MIFFKSTLEFILEAKDQVFDVAVEALQNAQALVVAAKESEIIAARSQIEKLEEQLRYERSRADSLVDRLLVRDAKVAAVAPVAVAAAREKDEVAIKKLREVFDQVNSVTAEIPGPKEPRAHSFSGGGDGVLTSV